MLYELYTIVQKRIQVANELASRRAFYVPGMTVKGSRHGSSRNEASEKPVLGCAHKEELRMASEKPELTEPKMG